MNNSIENEVISEFDILLIVAFFHYHVFSHPILKKTRTPPTAPQSKTSSSFVLLKCWSISCCSADCSIQRTLFLALSIWTTSKTRFMLLGDRSLDCISDRRHLGSGLASQSDTGRTSQLKNINATRTSGSYFTDAFPENKGFTKNPLAPFSHPWAQFSYFFIQFSNFQVSSYCSRRFLQELRKIDWKQNGVSI